MRARRVPESVAAGVREDADKQSPGGLATAPVRNICLSMALRVCRTNRPVCAKRPVWRSIHAGVGQWTAPYGKD